MEMTVNSLWTPAGPQMARCALSKDGQHLMAIHGTIRYQSWTGPQGSPRAHPSSAFIVFFKVYLFEGRAGRGR